MADLKNRCIAVGDANSTIRLWATFYLVQAGIPATNMKSFEQPEGDPASTAARLRRAPKVGKSQKISDRSPPIQAVLSRTCDAGAVSEKVLERTRATNAPLVVLKTFPSSPVFWLASSSLPGEIARAFQQAMVSLADPLMFNRLSDHVTSYAEVNGDELKALRQAASLVTEQAGEENEEKE